MRTIFLLLFCVVFLSCDKKKKQQIPIENIKIEETVAQVKVEDKLIFTVQNKQQYFFPPQYQFLRWALVYI